MNKSKTYRKQVQNWKHRELLDTINKKKKKIYKGPKDNFFKKKSGIKFVIKRWINEVNI